MAKKLYRVLERSFIGNRIVEAGQLIEYSGFPGKNLAPVGDPEQDVLPPVEPPSAPVGDPEQVGPIGDGKGKHGKK